LSGDSGGHPIRWPSDSNRGKMLRCGCGLGRLRYGRGFPKKIGAMNRPARNPLEEISWFGRQGFHFVDFPLEPPAADLDQIDVGAIRAAFDRYGLGIMAHTAWFIPLSSPVPGASSRCSVPTKTRSPTRSY
jgi:hypothetical protein